jgi:hypothetical protein
LSPEARAPSWKTIAQARAPVGPKELTLSLQ